MARVFTTEFVFDNYCFKGLVLIQDDPIHGLIIRLRVFDKESIRILGNDSIEFAGLNGYKKLKQVQHLKAQELLDAVHQAILKHLAKPKP